MDDQIENTVNRVVEKIGAVVNNALTLSVETWYLTVDGEEGAAGAAGKPEFDTKSRPLAKTEIKADGDSKSVVPMRQGDNGRLEIDPQLLELHHKNVQIAREYRAEIVSSFITLISTLRKT